MLNLLLLAFVVGCVMGGVVGSAWQADYEARPLDPED